MLSIYKLQIQSQNQPLRHIRLSRAKKCTKPAVMTKGLERRRVLAVGTETASSSLLLGRKPRFLKTYTEAECLGAVATGITWSETVSNTMYVPH